MAIASPKTTWQVGTPRRSASLSSAGRSSWMSEYVWIISRPHAGSSAGSHSPPAASAAARHRIGRRRLPPAKSECRTARWIVAGQASTGGTSRSSASSTAARRAARYSETLVSTRVIVVALVLGREGHRLPLRRLLQDDLDGLLDLGELAVAVAGERHPFLEELELLLET